MHPTTVLSPFVQVLAGLAAVDKQDGSQPQQVSPAMCKTGCHDFGLYMAHCSHDDKACIHNNHLSITQHRDWCLKTTKVCTDLSLRDLHPEDKGLAKELEYFSWDEEHCESHEPEWSGFCRTGDELCIRKHWEGIQAHKDDCVSMRRDIRSDVHSKKSAWNAAHISAPAIKMHGGHVTLTARAMATPTPDDQTNVAARSANDDCKCFGKMEGRENLCAPDGTNCVKGETFETIRCITSQKVCDEYAQVLKERADITSTVTLPAEGDEYTMALQARAGAATNPWDDLGPVTFRTERPETAVHEIGARQVSTTTLMGQETLTYATPTTEVIDIMSVIVITDGPSPASASNTVTPTTTSSSTSSPPTGSPITTISNITPGMNTIAVPMQSAAPVVVVSAPSESWSTGYTTETLWSSVWEPVNTPISTRTQPVRYLVPNTARSENPTGKTSSASTARSGAGLIVVAGVGALAACFMMF